jgi:hypothetical protein
MMKLGMRQVIEEHHRRKKMPLSAYVAKLRAEARRDRREIEGLWVMWSHAPDQERAANHLRNISRLQRLAAEAEARADKWEREMVRQAEAAHRPPSPEKFNDIKDLGCAEGVQL